MKPWNFLTKFLKKSIPFNEKEVRLLEENGFILNSDKTVADDGTGDNSSYHSDIKQITKTISGYESSVFMEILSWATIDSFIYRASQKRHFKKLKEAIAFFRST
jgi:hypothetical protein